MFEPNVYSVIWLPILLLVLYLVCSRLEKPAEYRQLSSRVPSATKTLWSEITFSWTLATIHPKELIPILTGLLKDNGPLVHFNLAGRSYVLLNDPEDIKMLLSNMQNITKGPEYEMLKPWLNNGLLLTSGSRWHNRRKLLTNTFHVKTLDMYSPWINKHARVLAKKLMESSSANGEGISIAEYVTLCSLDMICRTIMGCEMNAQEGKSVEYVRSIKCACRSVIDRVLKCWQWNDLIFRMSSSGRSFYKAINVLHDFTDNVIKSKRAALNDSKRVQTVQTQSKYEKRQVKSFLDLLIEISEEYPDQMTDSDIRAEVDTFLFEGHDTSSISMTMTLLLLGMHREIQDRVREELIEIFGDSDRDATAEDLIAMKYLEAVIKESLRLYPSVPAFTREIKNTLQLNKYCIPPMTTVMVYPYIVHRNEDIFPNPEKFIPERFLDQDNKSKFLFGYIPFSAGARNCIGQKYAMHQMKTVVSSVLRKARIETLGTVEDIKISAQLIIRIESVPKMKFYAI